MKRHELGLRWLVLLLTSVILAIVLIIQATYYVKIISMSKENAAAYAENAVAQAQGSIELIFDDMYNVMLSIGRSQLAQDMIAETDSYQRYLLNSYVSDFLSTIAKTQSRVENVLLFDLEGELKYYYYTDQGERPTLDWLGLEEIVDYPFDGRLPTGQFRSIQNRNGNDRIACYLPFLCTSFGPLHGQWLGYVVLLLEPDTFQTLLWQNEDDGVYLIDHNRQPVFSENGQMPQQENDALLLTLERPVGDSGWSVLFQMDMGHTMKSYQFFEYSAILIGSVLSLLLISWGILIHVRVTKPVVRLKNELENLDNAGLHAQLEGCYHGEIGEIAGSVNLLLERLHELTRHIFSAQQEMYESALQRKETLLYALQTQVNPHFLFNTLQSIAGIAASKDVPEIVDASLAMSRIFQYSIREQRTVTIRDELEIVREYLKIIDIRFMGQFSWDIDVEEEVLDGNCLKMMLQPLVENAIYHGLENTYGAGSIRLTGRRIGSQIALEILDSGGGMTPKELAHIRAMLSDESQTQTADIQKGKIGLANIQRRLRMVYGASSGLTVVRSDKTGTLVRLTLPYVKMTPEQLAEIDRRSR